MTDIMVDLETLSTKPNALIVSIGAVKFSVQQGVYDKFYIPCYVRPDDILYNAGHTTAEGFDISISTLQWWDDQSDDVRAVLAAPSAVAIDSALTAFSEWVLAGDTIKNIRLWGNGASFDNVILAEAYRLCNLERPWMFWNDRCYRTVKALKPDIPAIRVGMHHNALDDAITQAEHLLSLQLL